MRSPAAPTSPTTTSARGSRSSPTTCCGSLQGGVLRIARDTPRTLPVALFGPRNIVRGSFRLQFAAFRPRSVCSRTHIEPDNDHTNTPTTMSIDGVFFLSFWSLPRVATSETCNWPACLQTTSEAEDRGRAAAALVRTLRIGSVTHPEARPSPSPCIRGCSPSRGARGPSGRGRRSLRSSARQSPGAAQGGASRRAR